MKKLIAIMLCLALCASLLGTTVLAAGNPNAYTLTAEKAGDGKYNIYLEQTAGNAPMTLLQALITCVPAPETVTYETKNGSGVFAGKTDTGIQIVRDDGETGLAFTEGEEKLVATVTLPANAVMTLADKSGATNREIKLSAPLQLETRDATVTETPALSGAATVSGGTASLTLAETATEDMSFEVYTDAGGSAEAAGVTAVLEVDKKTVSLSFTTPPTVAANYYVTATAPGKAESVPIPVSVFVKGTDTLSMIFPANAPKGESYTVFQAQYDESGRMVGVKAVESSLSGPFSVKLESGTDMVRLMAVAQHSPVCDAVSWEA